MAKKRRARRKPARRAAARRRSRKPSPRTPARPQRKPVKRKLPARKPTPRKRRRAKKPTGPVVLPPQSALRLEERTVWRKGGRIVKKGTKGAKRYRQVVQLSDTGQVVRSIEQHTATKIIKLVVPSKLGFFEEEGGNRQGRIDWALIHSSVTSDLNRTKKVEVAIRWQDARGKHSRIKLTLDLMFVKKKREFPQALTGIILEALRDHGFRTNYTIELFKKARRKGLKFPITWADWNSLEIARNLEIVVTLWRA